MLRTPLGVASIALLLVATANGTSCQDARPSTMDVALAVRSRREVASDFPGSPNWHGEVRIVLTIDGRTAFHEVQWVRPDGPRSVRWTMEDGVFTLDGEQVHGLGLQDNPSRLRARLPDPPSSATSRTFVATLPGGDVAMTRVPLPSPIAVDDAVVWRTAEGGLRLLAFLAGDLDRDRAIAASIDGRECRSVGTVESVVAFELRRPWTREVTVRFGNRQTLDLPFPPFQGLSLHLEWTDPTSDPVRVLVATPSWLSGGTRDLLVDAPLTGPGGVAAGARVQSETVILSIHEGGTAVLELEDLVPWAWHPTRSLLLARRAQPYQLFEYVVVDAVDKTTRTIGIDPFEWSFDRFSNDMILFTRAARGGRGLEESCAVPIPINSP